MFNFKKKLLALIFIIFVMLQSYATLYSQSTEPFCGMTEATESSLFKSKSTNSISAFTSRVPTTGTVRALVIFVRFQDVVFTASGCHNDSNDGWPSTLFGLPPWADDFIDDTASPPYTEGSLSDFYYKMSDSTFNLIGDIHFYRADSNFSHYNVTGGRGTLNQEALTALDSTVDYRDYDADSDDEVDLIIFVYRFWNDGSPFAGFSGSGIANLGFTGSITLDGKQINGGGSSNIGSGVSMHNCTNLGFARRLAAHEIGHLFYDTVYHFDYTGSWGIYDASGFIAMSGYEKVALNWVTPTVISSNQTNLEIKDANTTNKYFRIDINATDYFLLENRQKLSYYEQTELCNNGDIPGTGLMISHIRPNESTIRNRIKWKPADNSFDISSSGDSTDTYKPGQKIQFTPWTLPNSDDGSTSTGIAITNIRQSGNDILVDIDLNFSSGDITEDSWWAGTIDLTGDITVKSGATLTVAAGATVKFAAGAGLIVEGTLNVNGTSSNLVTFTRSGASGTWDSIKYQSSSSGTISYATIEYAKKGIWCYSDNVTIENCIIENFTQQGVYAVYSDITVQNSVIGNPNGASHGEI